MKVEGAVFFLVEVDTPLDKVADAAWTIGHYLSYSLGVADPVACYHGVLNVLVKIVNKKVCHRCYAALGFGCVSFFECCLAYYGYLAFVGFCHLEGIAHTGYS